ncbi:hypothetical protein RB595_006872 [Gaeumannomyces hyphopodioides]
MGRIRKPSPPKPPSPPPSRGPYQPSDGRLLTHGPIFATTGAPVVFPLIVGVDSAAAERWNLKHLVFHLAVHHAGARGARVPDQERAEFVSWPAEKLDPASSAANTHCDARMLTVHTRTRTMGRTTRHPRYYFEVGGFVMRRPGVYRLAVEVRESLDIVGRIPPRASYRASHDIVVVADSEDSEDSADEAEMFEEYNKTEMKFYETLHGLVTREALEKLKLEEEED